MLIVKGGSTCISVVKYEFTSMCFICEIARASGKMYSIRIIVRVYILHPQIMRPKLLEAKITKIIANFIVVQ